MTTAHSLGSRHWPPDAEIPSTLIPYFSEPQQEELLNEDYVATRNVAAELISLIGAAILAGLGAVLWIVFAAS